MFYHELADPPVSFPPFRTPLLSLAQTQNAVQICRLSIYTGWKENYRTTLGGNIERTRLCRCPQYPRFHEAILR